jgi:hypothetical protein
MNEKKYMVTFSDDDVFNEQSIGDNRHFMMIETAIMKKTFSFLMKLIMYVKIKMIVLEYLLRKKNILYRESILSNDFVCFDANEELFDNVQFQE